MAIYKIIFTDVGLAKLSNAQVTQAKLNITHMAIGDANGTPYTPTGQETALKNEVYRTTAIVKTSEDDANWIEVEGVIPADVGNFTIEEFGLYDVDGDLVAISNYPSTPKPILTDGSVMDLIISSVIKSSNAELIELTIDPHTITASKDYVDNNLTEVDSRLTTQLAQIEGVVVSLDKFPRYYNETDDTNRIERATSHVKSLGGGVLNVPPTTLIANFIKIKQKVFIIGSGRTTVLKQSNGINADFITLEHPNTKHGGLFNLSIDGNKANNTTGHGVYINSPETWIDDENLYPDRHLFFDNVAIYNCAGDGFRIHLNAREIQMSRLFCFRNGGNGAWLGGTDNQLSNSVFYWNGKDGVHHTGSNLRFNGVKCFGNDGHGFYMNGANQLMGSVLELQENKKHGLFMEWAKSVSITAVACDANGFNQGIPQDETYHGVVAYHSEDFYLQGIANDFHLALGSTGTQHYGVKLDANNNNYHIDFTCRNQVTDYFLNYSSRNRGTLKINNSVITEKNTAHEVGTFTPVLVNSTATYNSQSGHYTRFGNRVEVDIYLDIATVGTSTVAIAVGGLPFYRDTASNDSRYILNCHVEGQNTQQEYVAVVNSNEVQLRNLDLSWSTYGNLINGTKIRINGSYRID